MQPATCTWVIVSEQALHLAMQGLGLLALCNHASWQALLAVPDVGTAGTWPAH